MRGRCVAAVVLGVWSAPHAADACDCARSPPLDAAEIARYDVIFEGTARTIVVAPEWGQRVLLKVHRVWRGEVGSHATVLSYESRFGCGYDFDIGAPYLVFAKLKDGKLEVPSCSHTSWMPLADDRLAALGEHGVPRSRSGCDAGARPEAWVLGLPLLLVRRRRTPLTPP